MNIYRNQTFKKFFSSAALAAMALFSLAPLARADFDPGNLIPDKSFNDTQTFGGADGIEKFLSAKGSILANTDPGFLQMLREPTDANIKAGLNDPEPNLGRLRTAAELIWDSSTAYGLNPQVIIVTLQKEQSLITASYSSTAATQTALDHALGFNCTDSAGCDQTFKGFYFQLFGNFDAQGNRYIGAPASLMRSFNTPQGRGPSIDAQGNAFGATIRTSHVGDSITLQNTQGPPNNAAATQTVTLSDLATAALYRYTPHVYNGNYNFWKFFNMWFKYPNGTLLQLAGDPSIYIINNGIKQLAPAFVLQSRAISTAAIVAVSPTELSEYDTGAPYGPADNTIVKLSGDTSNTLYVFEQGVKHPVSAFVLKQRKLDPASAITVGLADMNLFPSGSLLTPNDGTLVKGDASGTVSVIENGKKMALSGFTFSQYGYSFKNVVTLPQAEVDSYSDGGFLLPKDGTLLSITGSKEVYQLKDQLLRPLSYTVFTLNKFSFKNVVTLGQGELANATLGLFLPPPDGTYFLVDGTGNYYIYKNGTKHSISPFVFIQRGVAKLAVTLSLEEGLDMADGDPYPPKDGTLVMGDGNGAIFVIVNGQKHLLDYNTWVKTYKKKAPATLPQAEVDAYPSDSAGSTLQQ